MELKSMVDSLSPRSRVWLWAGVAGIVLLTAGVLWWIFGNRQQVLAAHLKAPEAAEIVESLNSWKVPYKIIDDGSAITVASEQVYDLRMRLVSAGVPKGGHVGFEIFNDSDFGVTEFAQRVNYQRALQGELERTISSLPGVENTRVHLTIRRPGLFVGDTETSKASVAVTLTPGQELSRGQVNGIRSLVAAAVEGLGTGQVSVLDSNGALLAGATAGAASVDALSEDEGAIEQRIQTRLGNLLREALGDQRHFYVAVDVALNLDTVHEVSERPTALIGDQAVIVHRRVTTAVGADGMASPREEAEFAHGMTRREVSRAPGRVDRLSVAVMLPADLSIDEVERLKSLISASAGIDEARGDRLEVNATGTVPAIDAPSSVTTPAGVATPLPQAFAPAGNAWKILLVGTFGLLIGAVAVAATARRPRRLTASEREAVVLKLRAWLADGRLPQ